MLVSQDSFSEPDPETARTYMVSSDNKAFQPNMGGYSIFASSIDGSDHMVRLDSYMAKYRYPEKFSVLMMRSRLSLINPTTKYLNEKATEPTATMGCAPTK